MPAKPNLLRAVLRAAVACRATVRRAGDGQVQDGHRRSPRSPTSAPARCASRKASRRSPCTPARPSSTTPATARWAAIAELKAHVADDPRARQRRHLGGERRRGDDGGRPAATAWSSDAVASAGRGCSAISLDALAGPARGPPPRLGEVVAVMAAPRRHCSPSTWASRSPSVTSASTSRGTSPGIPSGPRSAAGSGRSSRWASSTTSWPCSTRRPSWCPVGHASSGVTRTDRSRWRCRTVPRRPRRRHGSRRRARPGPVRRMSERRPLGSPRLVVTAAT